MRLLLAVTHLLGAGHLTRSAAIARAAATAGHDVTLVSGGRPAPLIRHDGTRLVQLPPVRAAIGDLATLRDAEGVPAGPDLFARRRAALLATLDEARPDIVVTELYPFGRRALAHEFDALIAAASSLRPRPALACSVRDILAAPSSAAKAERTRDVLSRDYDAILVHADPRLVRLEESWPVDAALADRLRYTGYVDDASEDAAPDAAGTGDVVVSGGSGEAGLPLCEAAVAAARLLPERRVRILVGHGIDPAIRDGLVAAAGANLIVEPARPDVRALLRGAALFVGQCGYNAALDVLATGIRALFVPFDAGGETEQRLRAGRLRALGRADLLPAAGLDGPALAAAIRDALGRGAPPDLAVARDGAERSVAILSDLAATARDAGRPA